jgi:hypothetical protein
MVDALANPRDRPGLWFLETIGASAAGAPFGLWHKPVHGWSAFSILAWAGGGGGGGGQSGSAGASRGGGAGGGGSPHIVMGPIAWINMPRSLAYRCGVGGPGGAAGSPGTAGAATQVQIGPYTSEVVSNTLIHSLGTAKGGTAGGGGSGGSSGGASTTPVVNTYFGMSGPFTGSIGQQGSGGGAADVAGTDLIMSITSGPQCTGGTGGGGIIATPRAGGSFTAVASSYLSDRRPIATAGAHGSNGAALWEPIWFWGGTGGGSVDAGTGGRGGNGAYGAGGGGGGAGLTGGAGGDGGPGLVIVVGHR